jgi:hypothetical protein
MEYYIDTNGKKRKSEKVNCTKCGEEFLKDTRAIKRSKNHYCSKECLYETEQVKLTCSQCGKLFQKRKSKVNPRGFNFCCRKCKDAAQNINTSNCVGVIPKHYGKANKLKNCICCQKELKKTQAKYCSVKCQKDYKYNEYIKQWKLGLVSGNASGEKINIYVRRYMFEKHNSSCQKCGWHEQNPYNKIIHLQVEHKDGHWENSCEENLELLCPNCHSLTPTYGTLNLGNGRKLRHKKDLISIVKNSEC